MREPAINWVQGLVLVFFAAALVSLVAILLLAPEIYAEALRLPGEGRSTAEIVFLGALTIFILVLALGVLRRWRWTFWLLVAAFLLGAVRVPASLLQLAGKLPSSGPAWYAVFQAGIGVFQFAIGLIMAAGYRRGGPWAAPRVR
jgi:hypothetical protein